MVEKIIENAINEMAPHLNPDLMEHLSNVLFVNFHGKEIQEQCTELTDTGVDGDELEIRIFVDSPNPRKSSISPEFNVLPYPA